MPAGRPKTKTTEPQEAIELICAGLSVKKACQQVGMSHVHFFRIINNDNELGNQYARAMEMRADVLFDETIDIADNPDPDADTQRDRLRVDARKWVTSKMLPKKYGDKITQELTGADGAKLMPEKIIIEIVDPKKPKKG